MALSSRGLQELCRAEGLLVRHGADALFTSQARVPRLSRHRAWDFEGRSAMAELSTTPTTPLFQLAKE